MFSSLSFAPLRSFYLSAFGLLTLAAPALGATSAAPENAAATTNANPAPQALLSRLPDPSKWEQSPLQRVVKDADPILKDPTFQRLLATLRLHDGRNALKLLRELNTRFPAKYPELHLLRGGHCPPVSLCD